MTNTELIAKIKAEIERQQKENVNYDENGGFASYCDHSTWLALESMLTFVSGLEETEKPMNQEGLEEELDKWRHNHFHGKRDDHFSGEYLERTSQLDLARHFAKWGAEHLADARKTSSKGLEEAAREYGFEEYRRRCNGGEYGTSEDAFIFGAKWKKEQMMKEAVEGVFLNNPYPTISLDDCEDYDFKDNQEIRIIIVKED